MNDLLQPAIVAAVISAFTSMVVALVGLWLNLRTTRALHQQRLATDLELAEKRTMAEIGLAKRRFVHDLRLEAWKRKVELAEQVLIDFYNARDIIASARAPYADGAGMRLKEEWETEEDTKILDAHNAVIEGLYKEKDFFAAMFARRIRFIGLFGPEAGRGYELIEAVRARLMLSVRRLIRTHRERNLESLAADRKEWEETIKWSLPSDLSDPSAHVPDRIADRVDQAVLKIEQICRPVIEGTV